MVLLHCDFKYSNISVSKTHLNQCITTNLAYLTTVSSSTAQMGKYGTLEIWKLKDYRNLKKLKKNLVVLKSGKKITEYVVSNHIFCSCFSSFKNNGLKFWLINSQEIKGFRFSSKYQPCFGHFYFH